MSEQAEREIELVAGTIGGITQKKADTWTIQVTPPGSNFAKNLWTKDADLVTSLSAKIGQEGAFVGSLGASYMVQGKEVRSWWIDHASDGTENLPVATPAAAPKATTSQPAPRVYAPDLKDRMIVRQSALKAAAEIVAASPSAHPDYDAALETMKAAQRFETWVYRDIADPPSSGPELSAHDQEIPF